MTSEALRRVFAVKRADPFNGALPEGERIYPDGGAISAEGWNDIGNGGGCLDSGTRI